MTQWIAICLFALCLFSPLPAFCDVKQEIVVGLAKDVPHRAAERAWQAQGAVFVREVPALRVMVIRVPEQARDRVVQALSRRPEFRWAEAHAEVEVDVTPDDPKYGMQWHHPMIGSEVAWEEARGNGVTLCVVDTGVQADHEDLAGRIVGVYNARLHNDDVLDIHGHGTTVIGSAAAVGNNALGVAGVGWQLSILAVRADADESPGRASTVTLAEGVIWCIDQGARVANLSWSSTMRHQVIADAGQYAIDHGGLLVGSAGNSNSRLDYPDVLSVFHASATNQSDARAGFSSWGPYVDVAAPGQSIWTTCRMGSLLCDDRFTEPYRAISGTSFSAPITAAMIAVIWSRFPHLTPVQMENVVEKSATDLGDSGWDEVYGHGRIAFDRALAAAREVPQIVPPPNPPQILTAQDGSCGRIRQPADTKFPAGQCSPQHVSLRPNEFLMIEWERPTPYGRPPGKRWWAGPDSCLATGELLLRARCVVVRKEFIAPDEALRWSEWVDSVQVDSIDCTSSGSL